MLLKSLIPVALLSALSVKAAPATPTEPARGALGGFCGGIAGFPCEAPLVCKLGGDYPDAGGICVEPVRTTSSSPSPSPRPPQGTLGGFCGGIAGISCAAGLYCNLYYTFPDSGGECIIRGAGHNQPCGGIAATPCSPPFICKLNGTNPDAGGLCRTPPRDIGGVCGGVNFYDCKEGLVCVVESGKPDDYGKCEKPAAGLFEKCGGVAGIKCQGTYVCKLDGTNPDAEGTCRLPPGGPGESCGGLVGKPCVEGFFCQFGPDGGAYDLPGVCVRPPLIGYEGQYCGNNNGLYEVICMDDHYCQPSKEVEGAGTCVKAVLVGEGKSCTKPGIKCEYGLKCLQGRCKDTGVGLGKMCGGIAGIQCRRELTCKIKNPNTTTSDLAGVCVKKV